MSGGRARVGSSEAGFTLVALMASVAVMLILMGVGARSWQYVMKSEREEELIFRGGQIADAIQRFQAKNGNALPTSLTVLVKGRFLRKVYKDPMAKDGEWRLVRQGEAIAPIPAPSASPGGSPPPTTRPSGPGVPVGQSFGGIIGVASKSTEQSLRLFNGRSRYNEWIFAVGQPRVVGRTPATPLVPGGGPPRLPGPTPSAR
jgi:type II secretory pathway pseudopilin PulG